MTYATNEPLNDVELEVVRASEITPKEVRWLWYPYIPFGKVTLLQGDPGDGKSKLMLTLSALLSQGKPLPFAEAAPETTEPPHPAAVHFFTIFRNAFLNFPCSVEASRWATTAASAPLR